MKGAHRLRANKALKTPDTQGRARIVFVGRSRRESLVM